MHTSIKLGLCLDQNETRSPVKYLDRSGEFFSNYMYRTCKMMMSYVKNRTYHYSIKKKLSVVVLPLFSYVCSENMNF